MSDLREQIEAAISFGLEGHGSAWIDGHGKVKCYDCGAEMPEGLGWHQIQMAAEDVLKIIEPQEATAP